MCMWPLSSHPTRAVKQSKARKTCNLYTYTTTITSPKKCKTILWMAFIFDNFKNSSRESFKLKVQNQGLIMQCNTDTLVQHCQIYNFSHRPVENLAKMFTIFSMLINERENGNEQSLVSRNHVCKMWNTLLIVCACLNNGVYMLN